MRDVPWAAFQCVGGELDVGGRATGAALRDDVAGATFALAALRGYAEFELDLVKTQARTGMAGNFAVRDSAADANDHGVAWLVIGSIGVQIINANLSHLQSWVRLFSALDHRIDFKAHGAGLKAPVMPARYVFDAMNPIASLKQTLPAVWNLDAPKTYQAQGDDALGGLNLSPHTQQVVVAARQPHHLGTLGRALGRALQVFLAQ